jgi:hypothetical protein
MDFLNFRIAVCCMQSKQPLVKVALLYDEHRHHFAIDDATDDKCQLVTYELKTSSRKLGTTYSVKINFTGGIFGIFTQVVVFDFGQRPVLVRQLKVELGDRAVQDKVTDLHYKLQFSRL